MLSTLVTDGKLAVEAQVAAALASAGIIGIEEKRALGLVPATYPVVDPEPERRTREQLRVVLQGGTPRVEEVSSEVTAGDAVARAVAAMNTAIMTAASVPAIAAGGSGG